VIPNFFFSIIFFRCLWGTCWNLWSKQCN